MNNQNDDNESKTDKIKSESLPFSIENLLSDKYKTGKIVEQDDNNSCHSVETDLDSVSVNSEHLDVETHDIEDMDHTTTDYQTGKN